MKSNVVIILWVCLLGTLGGCASPSNNQPIENEAVPDSKPANDNSQSAPTNKELATEVVALGDPLPAVEPPSGAEAEFSTNFAIHSIDYQDVLSGGPPKDGIVSIDRPTFVTVEEANEWIGDLEPVVLLEYNGEIRVYPLQILTWHEIVNDRIGDEPVIVTFCPLCNTAIAFSGTLNGEEYEFGTTGRLRYSNLIMYDRQTETWWQQATGEAVAGDLTGEQLTFIPVSLIAWEDVVAEYPSASVLSKDTGFLRAYGKNPYSGYDNINQSPFLYRGPETPGELSAMARVITVELNNDLVAYPYEILADVQVVNDVVGDLPVVVFWQTGVASALDKVSIADSQDVGAAIVYSRLVDGEELTFEVQNGAFVDANTGSVWSFYGKAISGSYQGESLVEQVAINHFWFSWAAFRPDTRIYSGSN